MRWMALLFLVAVVEATEPDGLVYVGLNEQGAEEWFRARDGATVIRIPGGEFLRRPYEGRVAEAEPKPMRVGSFFIDKFEVTNEQYARFLDAAADTAGLVHVDVGGVERTAAGWRAQPGRERYPVTAATGAGAAAFAKWVGGRIPEAAEWEKAAGGPEGRLYPWGEELPDATRANFGRPGLRGPMPVGSHAAGVSPYGCHDMAGNVYDRVMMRRGGDAAPVMIKGGSWLTPHPLNLRVLDLCVQPMQVADKSVGFRCVLDDPEPERKRRTAAPAPRLKFAKSWKAAIEEAKRRRVPIFLTLHVDTCGQCDRTRAQLFRDPRFIAYCNKNLVVVFGMNPGHAEFDPHPENEDGTCSLYPEMSCLDHQETFQKALKVVEVFSISPGNYLLHPDHCQEGNRATAILIGERDLPKWGNPVTTYLTAFEGVRGTVLERSKSR